MFYQKQGKIPKKRHIQYKKNDNNLFFEEHISREGFSSIYSNVYHHNMPTEINMVSDFKSEVKEAIIGKHKNRHFFTSKLETTSESKNSRKLLLFNEDVSIYKFYSAVPMDSLYRNSHFDELIYIQSGKGNFLSNFGIFEVEKGDFIVIPKGVIWKLSITEKISGLLLESKDPIEIPKKYRNRFGQLMEHSPFCERDITTPTLSQPIIDQANIEINVRLNTGLQTMVLKNHPFDLVGWDGFYFPWKFNINDFEPITGSIHQPPPVHQTFESNGFVICSFVSRLFDYHPDAIPSPYPHSNVDSDEVIFYSMGNFMSRNGIEEESITFHPAGITHGPHPGRYEGSIGKKKTEELAVMIDTFKPLKIAKDTKEIEDKEYWKSWLT